jgi:hypothetical protein
MAGETVAKTLAEKSQQSIAQGIQWGWHSFALRSYILDPANRVLSDDCLQIRATVMIYPPSTETAEPTCVKSGKSFQYKAGPDTAFMDLLAMHAPESASHDFTIVLAQSETANVGADARIPVHKLILAARSPVFRAMLSSGMHEASADEMPALRFTCETYQAKHLQVTNALSTLQRADLHNAPTLKRKALEYIAQNKKAVSENPALLRELSFDLLSEVVLAQAK